LHTNVRENSTQEFSIYDQRNASLISYVSEPVAYAGIN